MQVKHVTGRILFECEAKRIKEAVEQAVMANADLSGANLRDAELSGADLRSAKTGEME